MPPENTSPPHGAGDLANGECEEASGDQIAELKDSVTLATQISSLLLTEDQVFQQDIYLFSPDDQYFACGERKSLRVVLLDPQCTEGNWISRDLVYRLGMQHEMRPIRDHPNIWDFHDRKVVAKGTISFRWRHLEGAKPHAAEFFVGEFREDIEIMFGRQYITEKGFLTFNKGRMLPLMRHKKMSRGESSSKSVSTIVPNHAHS